MAFRRELPAAIDLGLSHQGTDRSDLKVAGDHVPGLICWRPAATRHRSVTAHLLAPLRPPQKHLEPLTSIGDDVDRVRPDGSAFDPWLRFHLRIGGRVGRICHSAMTIAGSRRSEEPTSTTWAR